MASPLTPRESEVVARVAQGKRNKEIARELQVTEGTVKEYLNRIFRKVGASGRVSLAIWAVQSKQNQKN